jgi:hypothetical protein
MRTAAMVLGIIGGVVALIIGIGAWTCGSMAYWITTGAGGEAEHAGTMLGIWGFVVFILAIVALVGGALSRTKPVVASILMFIGGIGGFIAASWFWLFPAVLLIIGAILALIGRKEIVKA